MSNVLHLPRGSEIIAPASADYARMEEEPGQVWRLPSAPAEPSLADEVRVSLAIARMRWKTEGLAAAAASLLRSGTYLEHFYGGPSVADRIAEIPLKAVTR